MTVITDGTHFYQAAQWPVENYFTITLVLLSHQVFMQINTKLMVIDRLKACLHAHFHTRKNLINEVKYWKSARNF